MKGLVAGKLEKRDLVVGASQARNGESTPELPVSAAKPDGCPRYRADKVGSSRF